MLYSKKAVLVMIPTKTACLSSWTVEYTRYLTNEHCNHKSNKAYICVYNAGEPVPGSTGNINGTLLHHVTTTCTGMPVHLMPLTSISLVLCVLGKHMFCIVALTSLMWK